MPRENDERSVDSCPKPLEMSVPKESPSLANNGEVVHIALPCLNGTLCDISWPICPPALELSNSMPARAFNVHII